MPETKKWILQPQECEGTYKFNGQSYMTRRISEELSWDEILQITLDVKQRVAENLGADYLQVFTDAENPERKIFVIDQLNDEMKSEADENFIREHNVFTVLFPEER